MTQATSGIQPCVVRAACAVPCPYRPIIADGFLAAFLLLAERVEVGPGLARTSPCSAGNGPGIVLQGAVVAARVPFSWSRLLGQLDILRDVARQLPLFIIRTDWS